MKPIPSIFFSSLLGLALCIAGGIVLNAPWFAVRFPSPGGEDDFSLRAALYVFAVCPAFLFLGGLIGYVARRTWTEWLAVWTGAALGSLLAFLTLRSMRATISSMTEPEVGTLALLGLFGAWIVMALAGGFLGLRIARRR